MALGKLSSALITQPRPVSSLARAAAGARPPAPSVLDAPPVPAGATQAQSAIMARLQPFIDAINAAADRRSAAGTAAIQGYAGDLAGKLGQVDYSAPFAGAEGRQAAVDSALQQSLTGGGTQLAQDLSTRLASIGEPGVVGQVAAGLANRGAAAGTTQLAQGSNALGALIANEGAASSYGQKLPGIAGLSGLQGEKQLQSQIAGDTATQLGQLGAQVPGLIQNQLAAEAKAKQDAATAAATADYRTKTLAQGDKRIGIEQQRANRPSGGKIVKGPDGYYSVDASGNATKLGVGLPPSSTKTAQTHLQSKTVNGHVATFDPATGTYYIPGTSQPVDPNSFAKPVKVSATALKGARSYLQGASKGFYASQADPTKPITSAAIASAAKAAGLTVSAFLADDPTASKARADAGIGWNQVAPHEDKHIQDLYVTLVKQYGIPARQAFQMVAGSYKDWGQAHKQAYFPKGDAAQGAASTTAATTPTGAKNTAFQIASSKYGWTGQELAALDQLWTNESGWNYQARNGSSGAAGIPQALGHTLPADYTSNPVAQINWGLNYIKQRYGSPTRALAFWQSQKPPNLPQGHWY